MSEAATDFWKTLDQKLLKQYRDRDNPHSLRCPHCQSYWTAAHTEARGFLSHVESCHARPDRPQKRPIAAGQLDLEVWSKDEP